MVRDAVRRDAERVAEMVHQLARAGHAGDPPAFTAADFRRDGFGATASFRCVVAELKGRLVGYAACNSAYDMSTSARGAHLLNLFVEESARGQGCGTALIRAVMRHTAKSGGTWLCFHVSPDNKRAIDLYRRLGARELGLSLMRFDTKTFSACIS